MDAFQNGKKCDSHELLPQAGYGAPFTHIPENNGSHCSFYANLRSIKHQLIVNLIDFLRLLVNLHTFACLQAIQLSMSVTGLFMASAHFFSGDVWLFSCFSKVYYLFILFRVYFTIKRVAFLCSQMSAFQNFIASGSPILVENVSPISISKACDLFFRL